MNPLHILSVNLQLSLSLISCIGLSISHLFLFLALSSPFRLRSVGTRWPLRLPPNKPPTLFFSRRSPPPSVFCPCSFSYSLQNGGLRLSYFLPAGPSVPRRLKGQMLSPVSFFPSLSQCFSLFLFHAEYSGQQWSLCTEKNVSQCPYWERLRNVCLRYSSALNCISNVYF